jgi:hypothetical protein
MSHVQLSEPEFYEEHSCLFLEMHNLHVSLKRLQFPFIVFHEDHQWPVRLAKEAK